MNKTQKIKTRQPDEPLPLLSHLGELRKGIIYSAVSIAVFSVWASFSVDAIIRNLAKPVGKLVFISPFEAFWCKLKLAFFIGLFLSMPVVLFQIWNFIQKGLLPKEKRKVFLLTAVSFLLFAAGASFCYFIILPVGMQFFIASGSDVLIPMITISRYLSFVFGMVFSFGMIFELPLVIGFLAKIGMLKSQTLSRQRRFAIVIIFIAAAALTPGPDVFSQLLMAIPLLILYEAGIIVARIIEKGRKNV